MKRISTESKMGRIFILLYFLGLSVEVFAFDWMRSPFLAHWNARTTTGWERNVMRVNKDGTYTGQWLWDHAILTAFKIGGGDVMYGGLQGQEFVDLLNLLKKDASQMDSAIGGLIPKYGSPPKGKMLVSFGIPYIEKQNRIVTIYGREYNLAILDDRKSLASWYIQQVSDSRTSLNLANVNIYGVYYHKEDSVDVNDDVQLMQYINSEAHRLGLKSVWVPYYNAPHAWDAKTLFNFDVGVVQPGLAFGSSIDGGSLHGDRLYSVAEKSVAAQQCSEYEIRGAGEADLDYWIAHQYLAVAQDTGASAYPQVFFFIENFFDDIVENSYKGYKWVAYTDLVDYLAGVKIPNYEIQITNTIDGFQDTPSILVKSLTWTITTNRVNSIRLDFNDAHGYWRGKVVVRAGSQISSYGQRTGPDILDTKYSSVFVPISNLNITSGSNIVIEIHRESVIDPWPTIKRLVVGINENPYVANPLHQELSSSSSMVVQGPYQETAPTHIDWARGRLTDGDASSGNSWLQANVVGWLTIPEGDVSIAIDVGPQFQSIKEVKVFSFFDQGAAVREFTELTALIGMYCVPRKAGTMEIGCPPIASSTAASYATINPLVPTRVVYSLTFKTCTGTGITGRYVSVTGIPLYWGMIDEIQVIDVNGNVVSAGKPYKVSPVPGKLDSSYEYPDRDGTLTDGAVFTRYNFPGGKGIAGLHPKYSSTNFVQTIWDPAKTISCVRVWITQADGNWGIVYPTDVQIQLRDSSRNWGLPTPATVLRGSIPTPSAVVCFPAKVVATGVKATFNNLSGWVMVSEITVE